MFKRGWRGNNEINKSRTQERVGWGGGDRPPCRPMADSSSIPNSHFSPKDGYLANLEAIGTLREQTFLEKEGWGPRGLKPQEEGPVVMAQGGSSPGPWTLGPPTPGPAHRGLKMLLIITTVITSSFVTLFHSQGARGEAHQIQNLWHQGHASVAFGMCNN